MIISPAKKMTANPDTLPHLQVPQFLAETEVLRDYLASLTYEEAKALWKCSDRLAKPNYENHRALDLHRNLTPAILCYEGIQYQYMAPAVFEESALAYLEEHLRILSGFYGILRPFDGVVPYRLEMQAAVFVQGYKTLYEFWGSRLAEQLSAETDCIINLASKEYSMCISKYLGEKIRFITCRFGELQNDKVKEKGTLCKMARGEMVRYMAEHQIETIEGLKNFSGLGFQYDAERSDEKNIFFLKKSA